MTTAETTTTTPKTAGRKPGEKAKLARKTLKAEGRKKRKVKVKTDKEFAKALFGGKSKRSTDRKAAFRKKKRGKK